eukprot:159512-Amphidinium_carterae.2
MSGRAATQGDERPTFKVKSRARTFQDRIRRVNSNLRCPGPTGLNVMSKRIESIDKQSLRTCTAT